MNASRIRLNSRTRRERQNQRDEKIVAAWQRHEDAEPDISTERLIAMVGDDANAEVDEIMAALERAGMVR